MATKPRRYSYTLSRTTERQVMIPPFWIDMSKLFELYVYKKLREVFPGKGEVIHHRKSGRQEPDFLLRAEKDGHLYRFVIDTKYKPRYENGTVSIDDVRQVSGYARLEKVYDALGVTDRSRIPDCLIIYSHPDCDPEPDFTVDETREAPGKMRKEKPYVHFYQPGIRLPEREPRTPQS
ncbi:MAG: McrC family protein [Bacteroides sp.]|nr:McrC family protein [Bacteroides sp.]